MNLRILFIIAGVWLASLFSTKLWYYHIGWSEGRTDLVREQTEKAQVQLAKQTTRQQADDTKAVAADESGKTQTEVITRDVIKYIKTPGRSEPQFSDERVRIKSAAADNAACIPGFDDCSLQAGAGK